MLWIGRYWVWPSTGPSDPPEAAGAQAHRPAATAPAQIEMLIGLRNMVLSPSVSVVDQAIKRRMLFARITTSEPEDSTSFRKPIFWKSTSYRHALGYAKTRCNVRFSFNK